MRIILYYYETMHSVTSDALHGVAISALYYNFKWYKNKKK